MGDGSGDAETRNGDRRPSPIEKDSPGVCADVGSRGPVTRKDRASGHFRILDCTDTGEWIEETDENGVSIKTHIAHRNIQRTIIAIGVAAALAGSQPNVAAGGERPCATIRPGGTFTLGAASGQSGHKIVASLSLKSPSL
jgi:hypothetical protein